MSLKRVVAITGCDSGLGWAIAARSAREGLITVAGMHQGTETKAAKALQDLCAHPCELDVTNQESVTKFRDFVRKLLQDNPDYRLYAVVNNAGIMTVGDFECQTLNIIENTINVNLLGAMRVASVFLADLRRSGLEGFVKPRIINVTSHCGVHPLPGFAPYSASKAGLLAWTRALRFESRDYGLNAISFIPGGFVTSSNIMMNQQIQANLMIQSLNEEQKEFYEKKIKSIAEYLQLASNPDANYNSLKDENIMETFMKALLDERPKELYKVESWRYMFYYNLLSLPFPEYVRHWLTNKLISFPSS